MREHVGKKLVGRKSRNINIGAFRVNASFNDRK